MENNSISNPSAPMPPAPAVDVVQDSPRVIVFPPILYVGTLLLGLLLHWLWPTRLSGLVWIRICGAMMFATGAFIAHWAQRTMRRVGTNVLPSKPTLAIVTHGPFRFTRNPIYLANVLVYIGLTFLLNTVWPLLLLLPMLFVVDWGIIRREERYLENKFGNAYLSYKNKVPRWL